MISARLLGLCCLSLLVACAAVPAGKQTTASTEDYAARMLEPRFAKYLEQWVAKVERVERTFYPLDAPRSIHGSVQLSISVRPDGSVEAMDVTRSSGHDVLDRAAMRIVELASPFAPFPPEIRRDTDILVIHRTWTFSPGGWIEGR
jgi:protein TonB